MVPPFFACKRSPEMPHDPGRTGVITAGLASSFLYRNNSFHTVSFAGDRYNGFKKFYGIVISKRIIIYYLRSDTLSEYRSLVNVLHIHTSPSIDLILLQLC